MCHRQIGFALYEILIVLALATLIGSFAVAGLVEGANGLRVELAAQEMAGILRLTRAYAARHRIKVAVKFRTRPEGGVSYALYRDGDRDGVRNVDIEQGVDPEVRPPQPVAHFGRRIRFGFPPGKAPRDPGNPRQSLKRLDDPIRFNRSDLASFSPRGTATPGTIYLTDGRRHLAAVRVNNRSGKTTILYYVPEEGVWR